MCVEIFHSWLSCTVSRTRRSLKTPCGSYLQLPVQFAEKFWVGKSIFLWMYFQHSVTLSLLCHTKQLLKALDMLNIENTLKLDILKFYYKTHSMYGFSSSVKQYYLYASYWLLHHKLLCMSSIKSIYVLSKIEKDTHWNRHVTILISFVTSCTGGCQNNNFQCSQWWRFGRSDEVSVSVMCDATRAASFLFLIIYIFRSRTTTQRRIAEQNVS